MKSADVRALVEAEIAGNWSASNLHEVDLRSSLVQPKLIQVIHERVNKGRVHREVLNLWLVLEENPLTKDGYRIVYDECAGQFGLVTDGALVGFYGDFLSTFQAM
jgi:hypothetical protein